MRFFIPLLGLLASWLLFPAAIRAFDCNSNGVDDATDLASGTSKDCNANGNPDECDLLPVNFSLRLEDTLQLDFHPQQSILVDLDGDGFLDIATSDQSSCQVHIHWNDGHGVFAAKDKFCIGRAPRFLISGDLDNDRKPDLLAATDTGVSYMLALGPRQFSFPRDAAIEPAPLMAAIGDFDGDGRGDLAAVGSFKLRIFYNRQAEGFVAGQSFTVGADPFGVKTGDMDGDGDLDLITCNVQGTISVFLNGGESFATGKNYASGARETNRSFAVGDFDGDADPDIAVTHGDSALSILFNNGQGAIDGVLEKTLISSPNLVAAADLDRDGLVDLAVTHAPAHLSVFFSLGNRKFTSPRSSSSPSPQNSLAFGDLDGDGSTDGVTPFETGQQLGIFGHHGVILSKDCDADGTPDECQPDCNLNDIPDACDIRGGTSRDCNLDHIPDECELNRDCNRNGIPDDCDLSSAASADCNRNDVPDECDIASADFDLAIERIFSGFPLNSFGLGDLDGDGDTDILIGGSPDMRPLMNNGGGAFQPGSPIRVDAPPTSILLGDLDGDSRLDLAMADGRSLFFSLQLPGGDIPKPKLLFSDPNLQSPILGDFNADGRLDIAVSHSFGGVLTVFVSEPAAGEQIFFRPVQTMLPDFNPTSLQAADLDGDGDIDAASPTFNNKGILNFSVVLNRGGGNFELPLEFLIRDTSAASILGDVDGDGDADAVLLHINSQTLAPWLNQGGGRFAEGARISLKNPPLLHALVDFNQDGALDIALVSINANTPFQGGTLGTFNNQGNGEFKEGKEVALTDFVAPLAMRAGDLNSDGHTDLAILTAFLCPICEIGLESSLLAAINLFHPAASRDENGNHIPDECENATFRRGDASGDRKLNIADPIQLLRFLFLSQAQLPCAKSADADDSGVLEIGDAIYLLAFLYTGGPAPPPPFAACGPDPTADAIECAAPPACP